MGSDLYALERGRDKPGLAAVRRWTCDARVGAYANLLAKLDEPRGFRVEDRLDRLRLLESWNGSADLSLQRGSPTQQTVILGDDAGVIGADGQRAHRAESLRTPSLAHVVLASAPCDRGRVESAHVLCPDLQGATGGRWRLFALDQLRHVAATCHAALLIERA